ncbi:MAG: hypothetical protein M3P82_03935 [Bacteroidota bacterium]|nr:hypothetical protein [Bacteroidota bacterium]
MFYFILLVVVSQRLTELWISKKNEKWLLDNGAVEYGQEHYKFIVLLHTLFFVSLIAEYNLRGRFYDLNVINYLFLVFFFFLQVMRVWVLKSLGKYWNTKIFRIFDSGLVSTGPYKFLKHPNYIIVICEIFTLPMIFGLYYTAIIFSVLNAIMLTVRIGVENSVLEKPVSSAGIRKEL